MTVGIDHPPTKLFKSANVCKASPKELESSSIPASDKKEGAQWLAEGLLEDTSYIFKATKLRDLIVWSVLWWAYILILCKISVGKSGGLEEMFSEYV